MMAQSTDPTIVLITGANQGIGFESVRLLARSPKAYHILLGTRSLPKGEAAISTLTSTSPKPNNAITPIQIDVTDDASIAAAVKVVDEQFGRLDVLVNNAGIATDRRPDAASVPIRTSFRQVFETNVFGAAAVTEAFLPLLRRASQSGRDTRLLFVTSSLGSMSEALDKESPFYGVRSPVYQASKAALNMLMVQYFKLLGTAGVKVHALCPGFLATNLGGVGNVEAKKERGAKEPEEGGLVVLGIVEGKRDGEVGRVVNKGGVSDW